MVIFKENFLKEQLEKSYHYYATEYEISREEIENIILTSLSEIYGGVGQAFVNSNNSINYYQEEKGKLVLRRKNISVKKEKHFNKLVEKKINNIESVRHKFIIKKFIKEQQNIVYGKFNKMEENKIFFTIYDKNKEIIHNLIGITESSKLIAPERLNTEVFYLFYSSSDGTVLNKNGINYIFINNNHQKVINLYAMKIFKKVNQAIRQNDKNKYSFSRIILKSHIKEVIIFLNNTYISKSVKSFISSEFAEILELKTTIITNKKRPS